MLRGSKRTTHTIRRTIETTTIPIEEIKQRHPNAAAQIANQRTSKTVNIECRAHAALSSVMVGYMRAL